MFNVLDVILLQSVPASYRVSAYYYLARTELNNDRIAEGLEKLEKAFRECKADSDNVKHILRVLIPVSGRGRGQGGGCGRGLPLPVPPAEPQSDEVSRPAAAPRSPVVLCICQGGGANGCSCW